MSLTFIESLPNNTRLATEICIVGAGPAGITLAMALDKAGVSTILLESGSFESETETQSLYTTTSNGIGYSGANTRLRQFGGSSNCWSGWCRPMDEEDFRKREYIPHSGWPIEYAEYVRYLPDAHVICEIGEVDYSLNNWKSEFSKPLRDYPILKSKQLNNGIWQHSPPTRFGLKYRANIEASSNCTAILHANVTSVSLAGSFITGVQAKNFTGNVINVSARLYVLACGGIENARMLMTLNGVGKPALGNEYGLVGRFFSDHMIFKNILDFYPITNHLRQYIDLIPVSSETPHAVTPWVSVEKKLRKRLRLSNTTLRLQRAIAVSEKYKAKHLIWKWLRQIHEQDRNTALEFSQMPSVIISEMIPNPDSRIELNHRLDALGVPQVRLDWRVQHEDLQSADITAKLIAQECLRLGVARSSAVKVPDMTALNESEFWVGNHHYGTTRMASNPQLGVVDQNCQVHSLPNLFIAGSSVFPTTGSCTPTLSIVAISLRLAEYLHERLSA